MASLKTGSILFIYFVILLPYSLPLLYVFNDDEVDEILEF